MWLKIVYVPNWMWNKRETDETPWETIGCGSTLCSEKSMWKTMENYGWRRGFAGDPWAAYFCDISKFYQMNSNHGFASALVGPESLKGMNSNEFCSFWPFGSFFPAWPNMYEPRGWPQLGFAQQFGTRIQGDTSTVQADLVSDVLSLKAVTKNHEKW